MRSLPVLAVLALLLAACAGPAPRDLSPALRPHDRLVMPEGPGPFPAVVVLHTCVGKVGHADRWADRLAAAGYAALVVDSMKPRGLENPVGRLLVCRGSTLTGTDRAADVLVSLEHLRGLPRVDPDRLALLGFSHGGWAALVAPGLAPDADLAAAAPGGIAGLRAVAAVYPHCGADAGAGLGRWPGDVALLMLLAGADTTVAVEPCRTLAGRRRHDGGQVALHVYDGADHAFDIPPDLTWGVGDGRHDAALADDSRRRILDFLDAELKPR